MWWRQLFFYQIKKKKKKECEEEAAGHLAEGEEDGLVIAEGQNGYFSALFHEIYFSV